MRFMPSRTGAAHVVTTRRTYKDKVYCTHLLRRSYREDGKVKNETLGFQPALVWRQIAWETMAPQIREPLAPILVSCQKRSSSGTLFERRSHTASQRRESP